PRRGGRDRLRHGYAARARTGAELEAAMKMPRWISRIKNALTITRTRDGDGFIPVGAATAEAVQARNANVVMAPLLWIGRAFTQAEPIVERKRGGMWRVVEDHPLAQLLERPNPYYDGDSMFKALLISWFIDGNAYLIKVRD